LSSEDIRTEVEKAPGLYSTLFQFPSFKLLIGASVIASLFFGILAQVFITPLNISFLYFGVLEGIIVFFIPLLLSSIISFKMVEKSTSMLNHRRIFAASILDTSLWGVFYILGAIVSLILTNPLIIVDGFCLGAAMALTIRLLLFFSLSFAKTLENLLAAIIKPLLGIIFVFLAFSTPINNIFFNFSYWIPRFVGASLITGIGVFVYKYFVDKQMLSSVGVKSTTFLKSFMATWLEDKTEYIENLFDNLGENKDIDIGLIRFHNNNNKYVFIIPSIHPGPFRTVGSSNLPSMISSNLEGKYVNLSTIFHGPSTHALNLARSKGTEIVIKEIIKEINNCENKFDNATKFVRNETDEFNVGCQLFGNLALVIAFAKKDTEDLAPLVHNKLRERALQLNVEDIVLIDCHNNKRIESTRQPIAEPEEVKNLVDLCFETIKKAKAQSKYKFSIGSDRFTYNKDLRAQGIGDSGIISTVIKTDNQTMVYVVIDGNNIVAGLRDKIRKAVLDLGFSECEIMTTDTHTVDGISLESSNMVGINLPEEEIIKNVLITVRNASSKLLNMNGCYSIFKIKNMRVAGSAIENILKGTINAMKAARNYLAPILLITLILVLILFIFL
jgi:putative membrane protein